MRLGDETGAGAERGAGGGAGVRAAEIEGSGVRGIYERGYIVGMAGGDRGLGIRIAWNVAIRVHKVDGLNRGDMTQNIGRYWISAASNGLSGSNIGEVIWTRTAPGQYKRQAAVLRGWKFSGSIGL
jgi:hypothetical protein